MECSTTRSMWWSREFRDEEAEDDEDTEDNEGRPDLDKNSDDGSSEEEDNEDDDEGKHRQMLEAVTGKSTNLLPDREGRRTKERVFSEAYPESEFNLNPCGASGKPAITVEDLIAPLQGTAGFGKIRKRMQQLQKSGTPVHAPLPKVIQERLDRKAGYQKSQEDITKWQPIVKRNREAPTLVFNKPEPAPTLSTASLATKFKPTTDLEKEVHSLLRESKIVQEKDVEEGEALELNKLSVEEVQIRQERLAKMRNLLFRHEIKAKRVKKIKSKTFHRILQKNHKSKATIDAAVAEADPESAKAMALKREFNRAKERMTLKHKNSTRWAKRILKRGQKGSENDGKRDAIAEQLRTHAELTRKINSAVLSDSDSDNSLTDSEEDDGDVVPGLVLERNSRSNIIKKAKVATLKALEDCEDTGVPASGLLALPFMARAMEKRRKIAQDEAIAMLERLEQAEEDEDDQIPSRVVSTGCDDIVENGKTSSIGVETVPTKSVSQVVPSKKHSQKVISKLAQDEEMAIPEKVEQTENDKDDRLRNEEKPRGRVFTGPDEILENGKLSSIGLEIVPSNKPSQKKQSHKKGSQDSPKKDLYMAASPTHTTSTGTISNGAAFSHDDETLQSGRILPVGLGILTATVQPEVVVAMAGRGRKIPEVTAVVEAVPNGGGSKMEQMTFSDDDNDHDHDNAHGVQLLDANSSQQELIRQAFAGDNVEAEFDKAKAEILDEEVPLGEAPVTLPGWGQWTHIQQKKGQPTWLVKEQEMLKGKRETTCGKRKDANLKYVIISEKLDKKASKFSAAAVPFPFSSRETYERSMRMPIGRDFNTEKAYQDMIRPAVIKSAGVIIDPIKADKYSLNEVEPTVHEAKKKRGK